MVFFCQGLSFFPSALVIWTSAAFLLPYITATVRGDVDTFVPYISDTGVNPPERGVFGIMLDIASLLGIFTMYIRYKHVDALNHNYSSCISLPNKIGLVIGLLSCFGLCVVANFQKTLFPDLHKVGAALTFGFGTIYILFQIIITNKMQQELEGKGVFWFRLVVLIWSGLSIVSMIISYGILHNVDHDRDIAQELHWMPENKGYIPHIICTISEWVLAFSFLSFFLTYIRDFQNILIHVDVTLPGDESDEERNIVHSDI
ncbi:DNA damage-regulated autophagy modulator protein 2 [Bombina bombina]|uniref:DNA damage-regulated autophagy modulator protein 2 n=1 Tax=Bombina bombina TaxID=8345 RepID=UPI00235B0D3E|nr:DNA damage-regulated autophagy modulator protein 2 [Bombina bombina]